MSLTGPLHANVSRWAMRSGKKPLLKQVFQKKPPALAGGVVTLVPYFKTFSNCLMPVFARRRSSNQFRLSGGAERHVRFVDEAQLVPGKLQTDRVNERRFIKGQLRRERVVRSPGSAGRHRLKSLRAPGRLSFLPGAVAALDASFDPVESGYDRRRAGLLALQRDAFQPPGVSRKQISLAD